MRAFIISTDESAFQEGSETRARFESYGKVIGEVVYIVISKHPHGNISVNRYITIVAAHGRWRIVALFRAYRIGFRMKEVEVVSAQDPFEQGFVGWLIAHRLKAGFHLQVHTDVGSSYFASNIKNNIRFIIARFLLPRADAIRTVSERVRTAVVRQFHAPLHRVSVLPILHAREDTGDDPAALNLKEMFPRYDSFILVVSRLEEEKNVALAIRAFSLIAKSHPKTGLLILDDGREKEKLSALAVSLGIDAQVQFVGFRSDASRFFREANIYLLTSDYEGYGRTLMEAAYAGCPIVTTDTGLVGSVLTKEEALICPPRDKKCIAGHLSLLLENPKLGVYLAAAAKKAAERMLSATAEEYILAYRDDLARAMQL